MRTPASFTSFSATLDTAAENELSRRYLEILLRWIPFGMRNFNPWEVRPETGHFFGGVLWYCQDTVMPALSIAAAAASPDFDEALAGHSREELRQTVVRALRYACFTHDTGPADCIRPTESWGRTEPAGKKWGERGRGFFPETNAGRQVANLAATALLVRDLLSDEETAMLAAVAEDFLSRFIDMPPRSGVFYDTQIEENAWTAFGLTGAALLLEGDPRFDTWQERIARWAYLAVSKPADMHDHSEAYGGNTVRQLTERICTTLPDNTAENHGFVHPSYMRSAITLIGQMTVLLRLWGKAVPESSFHHHDELYGLLKHWVDDIGSFHSPQGMDWPFVNLTSVCQTHAMANLNLGDPDGALLERRSLDALEKSTRANDGQLLTDEAKRFCHGQQDPAIMQERFISHVAYCYLAHRLSGPGVPPSDEDRFARSIRGTHVYPHGGSIVHVHGRGRTSFSWRNGSTVHPAPADGIKTTGYARNNLLARLSIRGREPSYRTRHIKVRDNADSVCALLVEDLFGLSIRRSVFFASLPDGSAVVYEYLAALEDVHVESAAYGYFSIMNDPVFGDFPPGEQHRRVFWSGHERRFRGYAAADASQDEIVGLGTTRWINVDDRAGIVFAGSGAPEYRALHHYPVFHAIENEIVLGQDNPDRLFTAGEKIGSMAMLWLPERSHEETAAARFTVHTADGEMFVAITDTGVVACNFAGEARPLGLPPEITQSGSLAAGPFILGPGSLPAESKLRLAPMEPVIVTRAG